MKLLVINPGSTSTKIGVYEDESQIFEKTLRHESEDIAKFEKITDQYEFRKNLILDAVREAGLNIGELDAVVGRGGLIKSIESGTYRVNDNMLKDLREGLQGEHASNLGGVIAFEIAKGIDKPSFIVDPVVVDELMDAARISGHPLFERRSIFHALNQKAIARQYCKETGKKYDEVNVIVAHMGGGISVGIHEMGKVIDVSNALNGEGPFSPERSGTLPTGALAEACFSGKYSYDEVKKMLSGKGGMVAYFGLNNMIEIEERAKTEKDVKTVLDAMIYQVSKEIGAVSTAVCGNVDAILLTGGICYSQYVSDGIKDRVSFIAEVRKYPGEDELAALALGGLRVLSGEEEAKIY